MIVLLPKSMVLSIFQFLDFAMFWVLLNTCRRFYQLRKQIVACFPIYLGDLAPPLDLQPSFVILKSTLLIEFYLSHWTNLRKLCITYIPSHQFIYSFSHKLLTHLCARYIPENVDFSLSSKLTHLSLARLFTDCGQRLYMFTKLTHLYVGCSWTMKIESSSLEELKVGDSSPVGGEFSFKTPNLRVLTISSWIFPHSLEFLYELPNLEILCVPVEWVAKLEFHRFPKLSHVMNTDDRQLVKTCQRLPKIQTFIHYAVF